MARVGIADFQAWKAERRRFACLTAYDAPTARILHGAGIPLILVGDSAGNTVLGYRDTIPVTMEEMLHHVKAARRGAPEAFITADLPFLSYQASEDDALENAGLMLKEGGADAVKLEGGRPWAALVRRMISAGIPVMGHLGLTPQSASLLGGYRVQATTAESARALADDALQLEQAGIFALVLECIPQELARALTERLAVPTIGIGAGVDCDGQVLVLHDLLGFRGGEKTPRFVRRYAEVEQSIAEAAKKFAADVEQGKYPSREESFHMPAGEWQRFRPPE
ncbi:MAG: 3-methyl-2-oxobutanoate hydroxymethyltransferase [Planctomycetes bacterium]|nr:3-methyl-2-oxobutanoate hydroxymethyltransferase [Planctomycetota bacterium]